MMNSPCAISGSELSSVCLERMQTIPLTQGFEAIVDDEDFVIVCQYKWYPYKVPYTVYAVAEVILNGRRKKVRMHRLIMDAKAGQIVDHRNHCGLDNRKKNLRFCSHSQNQQNKRIEAVHRVSRYKGVSIDNQKKNSWRASIVHKGKWIYLGYFHDERKAAEAYNAAAIKYHGEFASLNFI